MTRRSPSPAGVFFPKRPLLLLSVVVHTFTVKHLHFQSALQFLLMHRRFNNARLCFRGSVLKSQRIKGANHCQLWFTVGPAVWTGKPQHTCILLCINTVIHTGGYTCRTVFYRSRNRRELKGNAGR